MDLTQVITTDQVDSICRKYHIRQMALFGSATRSDFTLQSDIDILVEFDPGHVPGLEFFQIEEELSRRIGRKVDLQTANFLSPEIRKTVLEEMVPVYEQTQS